ncbi:hypothetical protein ACLOJK_007384 [Asimina triloba]
MDKVGRLTFTTEATANHPQQAAISMFTFSKQGREQGQQQGMFTSSQQLLMMQQPFSTVHSNHSPQQQADHVMCSHKSNGLQQSSVNHI